VGFAFRTTPKDCLRGFGGFEAHRHPEKLAFSLSKRKNIRYSHFWDP